MALKLASPALSQKNCFGIIAAKGRRRFINMCVTTSNYWRKIDENLNFENLNVENLDFEILNFNNLDVENLTFKNLKFENSTSRTSTLRT